MIRTLLLCTALAAFAAPADAEVRFGKNVRIGGHDVSNQTFNAKKRGKYVIHENQPKAPGCVWKKNRDGSKTKVCHLKRKERSANR
ncbi:hypothetical protein OS189_14885 [Sulfitobacter sp. F26169L]|uniref:hypothetical protein n=1 Tax=Sulfitobacter sp. F26169L TaxID=2996015 RepID=UPI0022608858|nr:hypothetical protein [Sulfitobacter sp. F26169L]MCX7567630.1 hypothetical protein [Sulfitobacter sp. F26169L]